VSDRAAFVARYGPLFEHSPWVAEAAWEHAPFRSPEALHAAMVAAVERAPRERRLALIRAHPDLSGAANGALSADSAREQASAGLDRLTPAQSEALAAANAAYRERFGFPFVICARERTAATILAAARARLAHDPAEEERVALAEIAKIAWLRLEAIG
jgi:OHCU decarboxylase